MGDFNLNLLNYETHTHTNDFVNSMVSHCLISHILQPTRVTEHSSTVIDNIFSNVTEYATISGNILNQAADHFSQFLILMKVPVVHKDSVYYTYDYSNFDKDSLLDDFSKISWDDHDNSRPLTSMRSFAIFMDKLLHVLHPVIKVSYKKLALKSKRWIFN